MPGLLEEFYSEDLNEYYYADEDGEDVEYYYADEDEAEYYYVEEDEDVEYYYVEEDDEDVEYYYVEEDDEDIMYYEDEILYYEEEEAPMYFKKEINVAPTTINTARDAQGTSWDAASYEMDSEISRISEEEGVDYSTAFRLFGQRYETYQPDLSDYV